MDALREFDAFEAKHTRGMALAYPYTLNGRKPEPFDGTLDMPDAKVSGIWAVSLGDNPHPMIRIKCEDHAWLDVVQRTIGGYRREVDTVYWAGPTVAQLRALPPLAETPEFALLLRAGTAPTPKERAQAAKELRPYALEKRNGELLGVWS